MDLFAINCPTCRARLKVREQSAIGQIVNCPKCGSMMQISPPPGWQPPPAPAITVRQAPIQKAPVQQAPIQHEATAAMVSALASADSGVGRSELAPAIGQGDFARTPPADYVDPLAVKVDVTAAAPPVPSAPNAVLSAVRQPVVREFLAAWLPWATVPLAGILSACLVSYCLRVDEPLPLPAPPTSETAAIPAPAAPLPLVESPLPEPAVVAEPPQPSPSTFVETHAPSPAANSAATVNATSAPAVEPPQPRLVMRPVTTLPLDVEAAARTPVRIASTTRRPRPARPLAPPPPVVVAKPKPAVRSSANVPQVDVAQALGTKIAGLDLPSVQLLAFVQLAGGLAGAPLTLDIDACHELGLKLDTPLTVHEHDVSLGDLLAHVLTPHGLVAEASQGQLVVTSTPTHRYQLERVRYNVSDFSDTPTVLASMIQDLVEPQRWMTQGGAGRIDIDGPQLLVSQTPRVQHQVVVLLDKLRLARGLPATGGLDALEGSLDSPYRQLADRLATAVSANFREPAELRNIVYELAQPAGVRVLVDWQSLASAGCRPQSLVSLIVDKQPLSAALDQLLTPLELSYRIVAPETIEIASVRVLRARPELDVYPAGQLVDSGATSEVANETIAQWLSSRLPNVAWDGGTGWRLDRKSSMLLVRQDAMNQRAIEAAIQATTDEVDGRDTPSSAASPASRAP
ncbi:MAG TPA: hypothetical protein VHV55_20280 [Pirellulales bacterium]|nr:hypothetical protein [Pirellulales bacterium]